MKVLEYHAGFRMWSGLNKQEGKESGNKVREKYDGDDYGKFFSPVEKVSKRCTSTHDTQTTHHIIPFSSSS